MATVAMLMVLSPAGASVVHPAITLVAPYKNSVASPGTYVSTYGCASGKIPNAATWVGATGAITTSVATKATTCKKSLGGVGSDSYGSSEGELSVAIPFHVTSNGAHSVATSIATTLSDVSAFSSGGCPAASISWPPALYAYEYAYCEAGVYHAIGWSANVVDLNNASWYSNYSYADNYTESYWENSTDCYNYGTPACSNATGTYGYGYGYGYNWGGSFSWTGSSALTMWTNGTAMVKSHHYVLVISMYLEAEAFAEYYNVLGHWTGSASDSINMATLGNGASLGSIVVT